MATNKLIKDTSIIIIVGIVCKFLGLLRESLIAAKFGTSYLTDVYLFALGIVILMYSIFGNAFVTTFIPILTDYIENHDNKLRYNYVNNILNISLIVLTLITIVGIITSKYIVIICAPGFRGNELVFNSCIKILRIIFISTIFIGLQSITTGVLQAHKKFVIPTIVGIFSNLTFIIYLVFLSDKYGISGFAIMAILAYGIQYVFQIPSVRKLGYRYKLTINFKDEGIRKMFKLAIPIIISTTVAQFGLLVDRYFATNVCEGAVSALNFGTKINLLVYETFAATIAMIMYPVFASHIANKDFDKYKESIINSINIILIIMIPAWLGLVLLNDPVIGVLYKRGKFDAKSVSLTRDALLYYSPSMVFYGIRDILNRAFFSIKETKIPMINSIIGIIINIILNIIITPILGVKGLAAATSISAGITTVLLAVSLRNKFKTLEFKGTYIMLLKVLLSSLIMCIILKFSVDVVNMVIRSKTGNDLLTLVFCIVSGVSSYLSIMYMMKVSEIQFVFSKLKQKLYNSFQTNDSR